MPSSLATVALTLLVLISWYWKRSRTHRSIAHLPGPPSASWLVGNIGTFDRPDETGRKSDFKWTEKYGGAFRFKGYFGEDVLYISDPKAMQYILNTAGYNFPKTWETRFRGLLVSGRGLVYAEGSQHARQRRVMTPSFSHSALKGYLPLFFELSRRTAATWKVMIRKENVEASVLNVLSLLGSTALEAIGEAAFGYKFNAIEATGPKTELHKAYQNLFVDIWSKLSDFDLVFTRLQGYAPLWFINMLTYLPKKDLRRIKNYMSVASKVAKEMVEEKTQANASGKGASKDVMSLFLKANTAQDPKRRLEEDEILPQITTLLIAAHESTSNTLSWILYELSRHPEVQRKLRDEVMAFRADVASRGDSEITLSDLDSMQYMTAVVKETLRYHAIAFRLFRYARQDDVIPLSTPQRTVHGDTITAIPVHKGQEVHLGLASYNRLKSVWGPDADEWRPERFLEELPVEEKTNLGVYGNLATFGSGVHGCIGWRFGVIEMQAVLIELIDNFDFSPAPNVEIAWCASRILQCMVKGQEKKGTQMPLTVSILPKGNAD